MLKASPNIFPCGATNMVRASNYASKRTQSFKASEIRELLKLVEGRNIISLAGGLPDPRIFRREELAEIARKVIIEEGDRALQYSPTLGVTRFRETLKDFMRGHGVRVHDWDDVIVTTGSQEALYLIGRAFIDPGDIVLVEEPTYLAALNVFKQYNAKLVGIPIDHEGLRTDILEEKLKTMEREGLKPKLLYTNPTAQNPSGVTMSDERRRELVELASRYDFLIVEDDPYSFFLFEDVKFDFIKSIDSEGRVLYTSTMSKILSPGLRIGWILAEKSFIDLLELTKQAIDLHTATLSQYIVDYAIREGVVKRTAEEARSLYKRKRDAMLEALEAYMSSIASWVKPIGGMFVMVTLKNKNIDTREYIKIAIERGVAYVPGKSFFVSEDKGRNTMRLNFSYPSEEDLRRGVKILSEIFSNI